MSFLDKLLGKKTKDTKAEHLDIDIQNEKPVVKQPELEQSAVPKLDLSKKIGLSFEKLNLDKVEVLEKRLFLLDVSGSMSDRVDGKRKIEHLRDVMTKYPNAKMLCFASNIVRITNASKIPNPNGGTDLASALSYTEKDEKPERLVLVSDGEPDSKKDALEEAKTLNIPIDIIFIGSKGSDGERFMEELAKTTGGTHITL